MQNDFFTDEMKTELINGIVTILRDNVESIILYGSVARNDFQTDSDIDIVLVIRKAFQSSEKDELLHWNAELDLKYGRVFSIVDIENDNLVKWGSVVPFYRNVQSEGIVLWKAA